MGKHSAHIETPKTHQNVTITKIRLHRLASLTNLSQQLSFLRHCKFEAYSAWARFSDSEESRTAIFGLDGGRAVRFVYDGEYSRGSCGETLWRIRLDDRDPRWPSRRANCPSCPRTHNSEKVK